MFVVNLSYILHTSESFYHMDIDKCFPNRLYERCASYLYVTPGPCSYSWSNWSSFSLFSVGRIYQSRGPLTRCYHHPVLSITSITAISNLAICQVNISYFPVMLRLQQLQTFIGRIITYIPANSCDVWVPQSSKISQSICFRVHEAVAILEWLLRKWCNCSRTVSVYQNELILCERAFSVPWISSLMTYFSLFQIHGIFSK